MKIISLLLLSLLFSCASKEKEDTALSMYELNKKTFSYKEIINSQSLCEFQNELAEKANQEKYTCAFRFEGSDTKKGEQYIQNVNKQIKNLENKVSKDSEHALKLRDEIIDAYINTL